MEDVAGRLRKIEDGIPGIGSTTGWTAGRRKSSFRRSLRSVHSRNGSSFYAPSLAPLPSEEELAETDQESIR